MRVLILNQTFYPDVAATAQHMWDLARHLKSAGHEVVALASRNVYGSDRTAFAAREEVEGIEIVRVGGTAMGKRSAIHRMSDFLSYYMGAALKLVSLKSPDVIIGLTSPPMISALADLITRIRRRPGGGRIRFIYYVMDVYPDAALASGMFRRGGAADLLFSTLTRRTLKRADAIIALGGDMEDLLRRRYGEKACGRKIHVVTPWADGEELSPMEKSANPLAAKLGLADSFNIVYSGNFGVPHDLETIREAIDMTAGEQGLKWVFIGGGKRIKELAADAGEGKWPHVSILPYQPRELLNQSLNVADVHLVSQLPAFTGIVVPSKLFGIMAVARPTIMVGPDDCEVSRILRASGAGGIVANGDSKRLVEVIRRYRDDVSARQEAGRRAREAFLRDHDVRVTCARLRQIVESLDQASGS